MKSKVKWVDDMQFVGVSGTGQGVIMQGSAEDGERMGPSPMEMLLLGMAGCTGIDVVHILKKARQPIEGCEIEVEGERADDVPRVFTKIHSKFYVSGPNLSRKKVEDAVRLSAEKYCSASLMLGKAVELTREVHVIDTSEND